MRSIILATLLVAPTALAATAEGRRHDRQETRRS